MIISNLIGIISDDLTGANGAGLQFHLRGSNTQVLLDFESSPQNIKNTQTWAVSTATRNKLPETASAEIKKATKLFLDNINPDYYFKKIDSTLRGNIAVETLSMLETLEWDAAIIIPAHPSDGIITVGGYQLLKSVPIERTEFARDPLSPIFESHIPTLLKQQLGEDFSNLIGTLDLKTVMKGAGPILIKLKELIENGQKLIVADAVSITDIEQISLAMKKTDYKILPAGTIATAQVLGNAWLPEMKNQHIAKTIPSLPKFIVSGSGTQTTINQIEALDRSDEFENTYFIDLDMSTILGGVSPELVERIVTNLGQNNIVTVHTSKLIKEFDGFSDDSFNAEMTKTKLIDHISSFLAELSNMVVNKKDVILITLGGETSYQCCRAINSTQLQIIDEIAPSISLTLDHKAQWIVSKSSQIGNSNTLIDILKYFENHEQA